MLRKIKKKQTNNNLTTDPATVARLRRNQRQTPVFRYKFSYRLPLYYAHLWSRPDRRWSIYIYYHYYHYII